MDDRDLYIPAYGVHDRTGVPLDGLLAGLTREGWPVYTLPGAPESKDGFIASIKSVLPLDPTIQLGNWDAMSDSLWEGLHLLNAEKVAVVWPESDRLRRGDPDAYSIALDIFDSLVFGLADLRYTVDHVTRVLVLLA